MNIKTGTIIAVITSIPVILGAVSKAVDMIKHDFLKYARNDEEVYIKHMINEHLLDSENATSINNRDGKIIVYTYPDKCIVVKRVTDEGLVSGMKVLPDPSKTEMIKEKYSGSDNGTVYAGQIKKFELGEHAKDYDYAETKEGNDIVRTYRDGCVLHYSYDKYGNTKGWIWIKYQH
jgi:hypothetical protein